MKGSRTYVNYFSIVTFTILLLSLTKVHTSDILPKTVIPVIIKISNSNLPIIKKIDETTGLNFKNWFRKQEHMRTIVKLISPSPLLLYLMFGRGRL